MRRLVAAAAIAAFATPGLAADLRICVEGAYPPFSEITEQGEVVGFDIDIANALCAEMGKSCDLVQTEWDGIIPALLEGKCDAIVASMSITEERKERIDFAGPYYNSPERFVARKDAYLDDTPEDLAGKVVGVQRGTIHQDYMEAVYPDTELRLYATQDEAYLDLVAGRVDVLLADAIAISDGFLATEQGREFAFFGREHTDPQYFGQGAGIGVRKEETALRDAFQQAIRAIREKGSYQKINEKYFEVDIYGG